ncbi:MAG TPA: isochorismate synthase [Acidimicrobiales bacterium]|nr:isochorismate synthase [Acidimicrobiales bacterium]
MTLVARTRRLDADVDLVAFAGPDGFVFERGRAGVAGRGRALGLDWPGGDPPGAARAVAAALAAIAADDPVGVPGTGPVAFGALPFTPGGGATFVVPEVITGRAEDGTRWITVVADGGTGGAGVPDPDAVTPADLVAPARPGPQPTRYTVTADRPPEDWCDLVAAATKEMAAGTFEKVVLARQVDVAADRPLDRQAVLDRLRRTYPGCHILAVGGFVAASPELLVSVAGDVVRSHPMAGTAPRGGDPATDQRLAASLLASAKDRHEHQVTIDMVHDTLLGWCSYVDYEAEPSIVAVANVQHLATLVEGRLSQPAPSVLELVAALHPTPAVAGRPRDVAVAWIAGHEGIDRGRYAGTAGWVDARGNGTWAVSIRCAEIDGSTARVWAGNGIVVDSDPATELAETRAKLQALLSALVRP